MIRLISLLVLYTVFSLHSMLYAQTEPERKAPLPSELVRESSLSPQEMEAFQNKQPQPAPKDPNTLKEMYKSVNFIDLRSVDATLIVDSGIVGDQNSFESVQGHTVGMTWEFPIFSKPLGGNLPIFKLRIGKAEIKFKEGDSQKLKDASSLEHFVDSLGVSKIYMLGAGIGYCYHGSFNCLYGIYNSHLTGQFSGVDSKGEVISTPTQLDGFSIGMTSTFDIVLGVEVTVGMEYSKFKHISTISDPQRINTLSVVLGLGFMDQPRSSNSPSTEVGK